MFRTKGSVESKFFVFCLLLLFVVPLAAMAGGEAEGEEGVTEVEVWFGREGFVPSDEFESFHEENPDIRVEWTVVLLEDAHSDYLRNFEAGEGPDVFQIFSEFAAPLVVQDALADISAGVRQWEQDDPEDFNDLFDVVFESMTFDGGIYGMNLHTHPQFLTYRADWIEEAGFDPPETWEDVLEISRVLQEDYLSGEEYAFAHPGGQHHPPRWMSGIAAGMGLEYSETGLPIVDSPGGLRLIGFYQTLAREGLQHPENYTWASGDHRGAFIGNRAAFVPEQIHTMKVFDSEGLDYPEQFRAMAMPYWEETRQNHRVASFGVPYMVGRDIEDPEAIMKVLRYIADRDIVMDVALQYSPTARGSVMGSEEYLAEYPYYRDLEQAFENQEMLPNHPRSIEINDILNDMKVAAQTELDRSPSEIAQEYQDRLNALEN